MAKRRYTEIIILGEDLMQTNFVRRFLMARGVHERRIQVRPCPGGRQAGEQYVRQNYPVEVRVLRSKSYLTLGLVAAVDADTETVNRRHQQLDDSLIRDGQTKRQAAEKIAVLVPKRNVETWLYALTGNQANETCDYKNKVTPSATKPAAQELSQRCPNTMLPAFPPSLHRGCEELTRLST